MFKCFIIATLLASIIFLIVDVIWLSFATKSFYRPLLGDLISDKPVLWAAALFYIIYVLGLAVIIIRPAIVNNSSIQALWMGFIFGLVAYGTYNLTNMSVIKNWSTNIVWIDMLWGGSLSGFSSMMGVFLVKNFFSN